MTTQTQIYKGKFGAEKPTESQLALLRKMNVREDVIRNLSRQEAFELIKKLMTKYYEEQTRRRFNGRIIIKW